MQAVFYVKLLGTLTTFALLQLSAPVIDRTDHRLETTMGPPGMSARSSPGQPSSDVKLPLILDRVEAVINDVGELIVELHLSNSGASELKLPVAIDQLKTHKAGYTNRKELTISMAVQKLLSVPDVGTRQSIASLFSSDSQPNSFYKLMPGRSVVLRVSCDPRSVNVHKGDKVSIFMEEYGLSPTVYSIASHSSVVRLIDPITIR